MRWLPRYCCCPTYLLHSLNTRKGLQESLSSNGPNSSAGPALPVLFPEDFQQDSIFGSRRSAVCNSIFSDPRAHKWSCSVDRLSKLVKWLRKRQVATVQTGRCAEIVFILSLSYLESHCPAQSQCSEDRWIHGRRGISGQLYVLIIRLNRKGTGSFI